MQASDRGLNGADLPKENVDQGRQPVSQCFRGHRWGQQCMVTGVRTVLHSASYTRSDIKNTGHETETPEHLPTKTLSYMSTQMKNTQTNTHKRGKKKKDKTVEPGTSNWANIL